LYSAAFQIGALLGGAGADVTAGLRDFGGLFGEIVQIRDDLFDAFQSPANPDWTQGRTSLLILYARTASHPDRARFIELLSRVGEAQALREAQQVLIRCGAVSYCVYHLVKRYRKARRLLARIPLTDPARLPDLLARQTQPVVELLQTSGADLPEEL
jgi:geranylgeranyl pyrophosphate synthase